MKDAYLNVNFRGEKSWEAAEAVQKFITENYSSATVGFSFNKGEHSENKLAYGALGAAQATLAA